MENRLAFCLLGAVTAWLAGCSGQASKPGAAAPTAPEASAAYSVTTRSASQPNRGACTEANGCIDPAAMAMSTPIPPAGPGAGAGTRTGAGTGAATQIAAGQVGRCDVESCEGNLSAAAVSELRSAAAKARDCYERELKEKNQLEGKLMVMLRLAHGREPCSVRIEKGNFELSDAFAQCIIGQLRQTTARPDSGCVDLALPLAFVRQEVEATPDAGAASPAPSAKRAK